MRSVKFVSLSVNKKFQSKDDPFVNENYSINAENQSIGATSERAITAFLCQEKFEHRSGYSVSTCYCHCIGRRFLVRERELGVSLIPLVALPVLFPVTLA